MRFRYPTVLASVLVTACCSTANAETAIFTGASDAEPIQAGFNRDQLVLYEDGFQIFNTDNPYRDIGDHVLGDQSYSSQWPSFFRELESDIHPDIVEEIGKNDFTINLTLDPRSMPLIPHSEREGQRFGIYLQFDHGQVLGGSYLIFGFDSLGGEDLEPGNRPFALVGQGYWSYYHDPQDRTGTSETITLVRRGDVFQIYTSSFGTSFVGVAGQRGDGEVYADLNGLHAVKPNVITDIGPNRRLTALTLWTESANSTSFDKNAARFQSIVIESEALSRNINPDSLVPSVPALPPVNSASKTQYELRGIIKDMVTGKPIYYSHVSIQRKDRSYVVITDSEGHYEATLTPGKYKVVVSSKGYEQQQSILDFNEDTIANFALSDIATVHHVGADRVHKSIQSALDNANDGDTVLLDPGTYSESLKLRSNIAIKGAGSDRTRLVNSAYRDVAITPFLAEYYPPYGANRAILKAGLTNVELTDFALDGGEDYESHRAEDIAMQLNFLMAIDRVDLPTVTNMLRSNPSLAKVRYYTEDSPQTGASFLTRNMDPWVQWSPERRADNVAIAKLLIEHGADIEGFGGYAWSSSGRSLHVAANHNNVGVIRLLLDAGADPNSLARDRTPIQWAVGQGPRVAAGAEALIKGGANYTLLDLVQLKLLDRLQEELGEQINDLFPIAGAEPTSLLHAAVRSNLPQVVEWLLEQGADPKREDANGLTPRQVAETLDRGDAIRELLGMGASIDD